MFCWGQTSHHVLDEPEQVSTRAHTCIICLERRAIIACVPCGHTPTCDACFEKWSQCKISFDAGNLSLISRHLLCMICRSEVTSILRILYPVEEMENDALDNNENALLSSATHMLLKNCAESARSLDDAGNRLKMIKNEIVREKEILQLDAKPAISTDDLKMMEKRILEHQRSCMEELLARAP